MIWKPEISYDKYISLENHGGGVSSGALLQKCNVLNDATLNIASRHFQPAGAGATVVAGAATFGNIQITATNAGDVSGAIINSINAVGNSVKTLTCARGSPRAVSHQSVCRPQHRYANHFSHRVLLFVCVAALLDEEQRQKQSDVVNQSLLILPRITRLQFATGFQLLGNFQDSGSVAISLCAAIARGRALLFQCVSPFSFTLGLASKVCCGRYLVRDVCQNWQWFLQIFSQANRQGPKRTQSQRSETLCGELSNAKHH
eukprot:g2394.t1